MSEWKTVDSVPSKVSVLVYVPGNEYGNEVFEAHASKTGEYYDPMYSEWYGIGATHWMEMPKPPIQKPKGETK